LKLDKKNQVWKFGKRAQRSFYIFSFDYILEFSSYQDSYIGATAIADSVLNGINQLYSASVFDQFSTSIYVGRGTNTNSKGEIQIFGYSSNQLVFDHSINIYSTPRILYSFSRAVGWNEKENGKGIIYYWDFNSNKLMFNDSLTLGTNENWEAVSLISSYSSTFGLFALNDKYQTGFDLVLFDFSRNIYKERVTIKYDVNPMYGEVPDTNSYGTGTIGCQLNSTAGSWNKIYYFEFM